MKAYFSAPAGDRGVRISFVAQDNSEQYFLELLDGAGVVTMSQADDEKEDAFVVVNEHEEDTPIDLHLENLRKKKKKK